MTTLFPALSAPSAKTALRFGEQTLSYAELADVAGALAGELTPGRRVAVWATPTMETSVAVVAALLAGAPAVPLNPKIGESELAHIVGDSEPVLVLAEHDAELPAALAALPRTGIDTAPPPAPVALPAEPDGEAPAVIVYTSGTTGPPKGTVLPRRALTATLDALRDAWQWTEDDVLVHGLPLFHVHGLILGVLGPLRRSGTVHHLGRFSTDGVRRALDDGGTMLFGVPTMYHRIAEEVGENRQLAKALGDARLLVSGSAALPVHDHERIAAATGARIVERYGMTETLMNTSVRADGERRPGTVGVPLDGVELRIVDEEGRAVETWDGETVGEIQVRGRNLFTEYLNRPDATAEAFDGGWFRTGDMATRDPDGYVRIVGRKATDIIKSGGYKIGAGEIENALLEHPDVAEAAVTGESDDDLGERIVAWIVPGARRPGEQELADHVAKQLAPHKRPRVVRFRESLPRNDMGKLMKRALHE
ncbi:acyl-CoA synthetase [Streptomyces winkii]|uniref:acyl-CoA synthetase n=1 Tax=Streptomyces winkii TaxID=3051178 RepID=UPI0028D79D95|nr:acyl-CoA synthetase [Streptomyces sp. DSM 40971]